MIRKLFISYARADDIAFVERLYNDLKRLGFDVWWDKNHMGNDGTPFTQEIGDAVRASERVLFVAGPRSAASPYCRGEWELALKLCIPVLPLLRLDDYAVIPERIGSGHAVDCRTSRPYADALNEIHRIIENAPLPPITPHGAPALPAAYIERNQYLDPLKTAIKTGDPLIGITSKPDATALHGVGGIGKTTLAAALCQDCDVRRTFDHIFWIEVGQNRKKEDIPSLMYTVGATFGDPFDHYKDLNTARSTLTQHLSDKKTLIVLDDVWAAVVAREFLISTIDCRIVVTSRMKDLLREGWRAIGVDKLTERESLLLTAEILLIKVEDLPSECTAIVRLLDGHTLAVSIAARHMFERGGISYAPRLLERLLNRINADNPFRDLNLNESDKNQNLEYSLSLSYEDLKSDLQRRFRQLGVLAHEGSFGVALLRVLWGDSDIDDTEDALTTLGRVGLINLENGRGMLHPMVRAYAHALLGRAEEVDETFFRYADYVLEITKVFESLPGEEWTNYESDFVHIDFVGDELTRRFGSQADNTHLQTYIAHFSYNVSYYIYYRTRANTTERGISARGQEWLDAGLASYRAQGNQRMEAETLNNIGAVWYALGEVQKGLAYYEEAASVLHTLGEITVEATLLGNIGSVYLMSKDFDSALKYSERAFALGSEIGDRQVVSNQLITLGLIRQERQEWEAALDFFERALALKREMKDFTGELSALNSIATVYASTDAVDSAVVRFEQAALIAAKLGMSSYESVCRFNLARVFQKLNRDGEAIAQFELARQLLISKGLTQNAAGATLDQMQAMLDELRGKNKIDTASSIETPD